MQPKNISAHTSRILLAAPDEQLIRSFKSVIHAEKDSMLALNVLDRDANDVIEYARASSIDVIISRGGIARFLMDAQQDSLNPIPIVEILSTPYDIIEAIKIAIDYSRDIAFIAYENTLEDIDKITELFDIKVKFIQRSSPWDCLAAVFKALELGSKIIVGDARVIKICKENSIPCVPLTSTSDSLRKAFSAAKNIVEIRNRCRQETRRFSSVLNLIDYSVFILNANMDIQYCNKNAEFFLNMSADRMNGINVSQISIFKQCYNDILQNEKDEIIIYKDSKRCAIIHIKNEDCSHTLLCKQLNDVKPISTDYEINSLLDNSTSIYSFDDIVGENYILKSAIEKARRYAQSISPVLIQGESGVGKELFAHAIHTCSPRSRFPFVAVNISALPPSLVESEIFGYVRGAFTDANRSGRAGMLEYAGSGTLFLDEIGELSHDLQVKLLRVLNNGEFKRIGDNKKRRMQCRIIAATNKNLLNAITDGQFRADLYYRLNILNIYIPSLYERRDDIPLLAMYLLKKVCVKYKKMAGNIDNNALEFLKRYSWPGNIRELETVIERYVALEDMEMVNIVGEKLYELDILPWDMSHINCRRKNIISDSDIQNAMNNANGSIQNAARALGMHRTTLWRRLKKIE